MKINLTVNIDGTSQMINRQAVCLINPHLFLVSITNRKVRNILFTINVGTGRKCHSSQNTSFKWNISFLSKVKLPSHRTSHWNWIFCWKNRYRLTKHSQFYFTMNFYRFMKQSTISFKYCIDPCKTPLIHNLMSQNWSNLSGIF